MSTPIMAKPRDYKKEYQASHGKPEEKKKRAERNAARAKMVKAGKASKGDKKDVGHIKPLSEGGSNKMSNLRMESKKANRGRVGKDGKHR